MFHGKINTRALLTVDWFCCFQSLVQNSRKAGITSAMASTTLGNEELVRFLAWLHDLILAWGAVVKSVGPLLCTFCRRVTSIKRPCRPWSTQSLPPRRTTSRCGRPPRPHTATNARVYSGASPGKACAAPSVVSNATRSARIFWMLTVCRVSSVPLRSLSHSIISRKNFCVFPNSLFLSAAHFCSLHSFSLLFFSSAYFCSCKIFSNPFSTNKINIAILFFSSQYKKPEIDYLLLTFQKQIIKWVYHAKTN